MHRITLSIILLFAATCADAASYQKKDGTIVDPIQSNLGGNLSYTGNNLEPYADLQGADLYSAVLPYAELTYADLSLAFLQGADLRYTNLSEADLGRADLRWADLTGADLTGADLSGAVLYDADLTSANLFEADLTGAVLWQADLYEAELDEADLSGSILTFARYYDDAIWTNAFYYTDNEPTWDSGMDAAWRSSVGILAVAPTSAVPEPSTLLLALLGLALLPRRRRR